MREYKKPEIKIIKFEVDNIITTSSVTSNNTPNIDGGSTNFMDGWLK